MLFHKNTYTQTLIWNQILVKLKMYNNTTLKAKGRTKLKLRNPKNGKKYRVHFIVVSADNLTPLLSRKAAEQD